MELRPRRACFGMALALRDRRARRRCPRMKLSVEYLILLTLAVSSVIIGFFTTFDQLGGIVRPHQPAERRPCSAGTWQNPSPTG